MPETDGSSEQESSKRIPQLDLLTKRENEVVTWILEGKANGDIATILGISRRTVEKHCESVYRKIGIENRVTLMLWAARNGLISG